MKLLLIFLLIKCSLGINSLVNELFPPLVNNSKGPNLSGAEFNPGPNKRMNFDYVYPPNKEIDYYALKGFGIIRLPFDISRVYPEVYSPLNLSEIIAMRLTVDHLLSKGMKVILDPHNYGYIYDNRTQQKRLIGVDDEATKLFADFWNRMGSMFLNYPNVWYGLMNEPHDQTAQQWYNGALPAIQALRKAGANQTILIPGTAYSGAHSWISSGNGDVWKAFNQDPMQNFAFEMHQYLDEDSSGTHNTCIPNSYQTLQAATDWLNQFHFKGFLAEFGWSIDSNCMTEGQKFLDFVSNNSNVWTGWTWWCGGPWYPKDYMFLLDPYNFTQPFVDRPQMAILLNHLNTTSI